VATATTATAAVAAAARKLLSPLSLFSPSPPLGLRTPVERHLADVPAGRQMRSGEEQQRILTRGRVPLPPSPRLPFIFYLFECDCM
jgi:hypothetical protein